MKKKLLIISLAGIFSLIALQSKSQDYKTAIGLRAAFFSGVTVKHFIASDRLLEGIAASRWRGFAIIGLYEFQKETKTENLFMFYGFGGHFGIYDRYRYYNNNLNSRYYYSGSFTTVGIDGILGLEYVFKDFPIGVSLDVKPYFEFVNPEPNFLDIGLSARYCF